MADEISVTETDAQVGSLVDGPTQDGVPRDVDNHLEDNSGADLEVRAGKGDDIVITGDGDDFIAGGKGSEAIKSGDGNDVIESWNHTISAKDEAGTNPNIDLARDKDVEHVGCVDDIIVAGSGNDYVEGGGNNDIIYGDRGAKLSGEEILVNGDFEDLSDTAQIGGGNNWGTYSSIPGWEADDNLDGVAPIDLTKDLEGLIEIQENGGYGVEQGDGNVLELDSHTHSGQDSHSAIGQYFELDEAGTFNLSLDYADRTGNAATNGFKLYIDGEVVGNPEGYGGAAGDPSTSWRSLTIDVDLGPGPHVLTIEAIGTQDTYGSLIDNVSLQQYEANDVLIGDGTPRDGTNVDENSMPGDDLIRGNKGADVLIGDSFDALSFNEQSGKFELDLDSAQAPEGDGLGLDNATAYNPDGSVGMRVTKGAANGETGYGVKGNSESGVNSQIGYSYIDSDDVGPDTIGSEVLSVCLEEHTMAAKVGISNLYLDEGNDGVDETGHWAAYREGILVAEGDFTAADLKDGNNHSGYLEITPEDTGFKAFDEIQFSAVGPEFDKGNGQDASDFFVTSVEAVGLTGDGTDKLHGGRGDDVLLGGDNQETLPTPENGMYDISEFNGTFDVELLGSDAGFNNSLGFYTADSNGEVVNIGILWADVKNYESSSTSISKEMMGGEACKLGFFVVPDGADNGIESEGFVEVSEFNLDAQLLGEAAFELGLPIHAKVTTEEGTSLFEWNDNTDLSGNDNDFNDVVHNVTAVAEPELLKGGRGDDWLDGGAGVDVLKGGKGDDVIIGGSGADEVRGGKGNDTIAYDAEDTLIRGGKGFDVLVANDKDGPIDIDMSKGGDNIKGIEAVVGTSSDSDSVTLTLGKAYHQGGASDNTKSKDDGQSEFFALGVEDIKLGESNNWNLQSDGEPDPDEGVTMTVADLMASSDYKLDQGMIDSLGLSGSDVLTAYTFTKGGKEVVIYTDAAFDGNFEFV